MWSEAARFTGEKCTVNGGEFSARNQAKDVATEEAREQYAKGVATRNSTKVGNANVATSRASSTRSRRANDLTNDADRVNGAAFVSSTAGTLALTNGTAWMYGAAFVNSTAGTLNLRRARHG